VYYNSRVLPDEPVFSSGLLGRGEGALPDVGSQEIELGRAEDGPIDEEEDEMGMGAIAELPAADLEEEGSDDCACDDTDHDGAGQPATQQSTTR